MAALGDLEKLTGRVTSSSWAASAVFSRSRLREPGLHLEELQQQREAEPGRPGLVPHSLHVVFEQRPALDQVPRLPVLPHRCSFGPPEITRSAQRDAERGETTTTTGKQRYMSVDRSYTRTGPSTAPA